MSLVFVPRNVKGKQNATQKPVPLTAGYSNTAQQLPRDPGPSNSSGLADTDCASLVTLALSDYALFSDPDLRRRIDESEEHFVALLDLVRKHDVREAAVAKSLRTHALDTIEVRMVFSAPSYKPWTTQDMKDANMFQVRRKIAPATSYTREHWRQRTLYVENCPVQYASEHGMFALINALLTDSPEPQPASDRVQAVTFLPHHLDRPEDAPSTRSFALITLLHLEDMQRLLKEWPWHHFSSKKERPTVQHAEAVKFGFRTLSKARWEELKEEFVAHRARLVQQMVATQQELDNARPSKRARSPSIEDVHDYLHFRGPTLSPTSSYPPNRLVYVKNLNSATNKTTLKKLFSHAFSGDISGLDYVDYNKGMDTCHLRLATPEHAQTLVAHISERALHQESGLDSDGQGTAAARIAAEVVQGRPEELYWDKVPLKIRREAINKELRRMDGSADVVDEERRKRRK